LHWDCPDDLDSNAFDEEKELLEDGSDAELDDISDSASMDGGSENDDDDIASLAGMDAEDVARRFR
jgi:ribosome biogenesis protein MAK21